MKLSSLFSKGKNHGTKTPRSFTEINNNDVADDFDSMEKKACTDPYLQHAWVSVCIDILTRNVGRASFEVRKDGVATSPIPFLKGEDNTTTDNENTTNNKEM